MAKPPLQLVIGNYNTSSWSLRASLVLRLARLAFTETRIPLRRAETAERIARYSPSGMLPVLLAEGVPIWDSLAIAEFTAELEPGIWPLDPLRRAEARAISAEMHSGFADLRRLMPMDIVSRFNPPGRLPRGLARDIERIKAIWRRCRERHADDGPFLFGAFSVADAMMAPVATRLVTHGVPVEGLVEDYVDSVMAWPDMVAWCDAAAREQEEREAHGSLGVTDTLHPGRMLSSNGSGEAAPGAAARAEPASAGLVAAGPAATAPSPTNAPGVAPTATERATRTAGGERPVVEAVVPAVEERGHTPAGNVPAAAPDEESAAAAEERGTTPATETERREWDASPTAARAQALPPLLPLEPKGQGERADQPPARKLGWIRRPVPAEHLDEMEESKIPSHPIRRAALGLDSTPPASGEALPARSDKLRPIDREASAERPVPPPGGPSREAAASDGGSGGRAERQETTTRPTGPAVKPIGSGILRRR